MKRILPLLAIDLYVPQFGRAIRFDHVHVLPLLRGLHGDGRNDNRVRIVRELQRDAQIERVLRGEQPAPRLAEEVEVRAVEA